MSLSTKKKGETSSEDFKCAYDVIRSSLNNYEAVYTDGSKDDERVAAVFKYNLQVQFNVSLQINKRHYDPHGIGRVVKNTLTLPCINGTSHIDIILCMPSPEPIRFA